MYSLVEYFNETKQEFNFRAISLRCAARKRHLWKESNICQMKAKISKKCNLLTIDVICLLIDKWVNVTDYQHQAEPCKESLMFHQQKQQWQMVELGHVGAPAKLSTNSSAWANAGCGNPAAVSQGMSW